VIHPLIIAPKSSILKITVNPIATATFSRTDLSPFFRPQGTKATTITKPIKKQIAKKEVIAAQLIDVSNVVFFITDCCYSCYFVYLTPSIRIAISLITIEDEQFIPWSKYSIMILPPSPVNVNFYY